MYFSDGSPYCYMTDRELRGVRNIGWLDPAHTIPVGRVDAELVDGLISHRISSPVNQTRGFYGCPFCGGYDDPTIQRGSERRLVLGSAEVWIMGPNGTVFAAPDLIIHYMLAHQYRPPDTYLAALSWFLTEAPDWAPDALRQHRDS